MGCPRSITFVIPGTVGVQVTAVENAGNIDFTIDVIDSATLTADLRAIFFHFNEAKLAGLQIIGDGAPITKSRIQANGVIDLGNGANMIGATTPFDIGIAFGTAGTAKGDDISGPVSFTLDGAGSLTLDDIAHLEFGARLTSIGSPDGLRKDSSKTTFFAPAAPDAVDDNGTTHEDIAVTVNVLENDSDGDGDTLTIIDIDDGPAHGTVTIAPDGQSLIFTPFEDYAGQDSFTYCVSDGNGGQDSATVTVNIIPVADPPDITIEVLSPLPGDPVNLVRLKVTATQSDFDGSEFIDKLTLSGIPANVVVTTDGQLDAPGQPDSVTEFIELLLPLDQDTSFNFAVTAESEEEGIGDPDEATATAILPIIMEFNHNETIKTFTATDQSIWGTGSGKPIDEGDFIGINLPLNHSATFITPTIPPVPITAFTEGHLKTGFEYKIHLQAGDIDATVPYKVTIDTNYNKTTDTLLINPGGELAPGGSMSTTGPEGFFKLDFIFDFLLKAGIEFPVDISEEVSANFSQNLFTFDSTDAELTVPLPAGLSVTMAWPHISSSGGQTGTNTLGSNGASNNFLELGLDVDYLAATFFPLLAPLDPDPLDPDNFELLDLDISGGLNFLQQFILTAAGLVGTITYENNVSSAFSFLSDLKINNASSLDANDDGQVTFSLAFDLDATLKNITDIGVNLGYSIDFLKNIPIIDETLFHADDTFPVASFNVFEETFGVDFNSQTYSFAV